MKTMAELSWQAASMPLWYHKGMSSRQELCAIATHCTVFAYCTTEYLLPALLRVPGVQYGTHLVADRHLPPFPLLQVHTGWPEPSPMTLSPAPPSPWRAGGSGSTQGGEYAGPRLQDTRPGLYFINMF